MTFGAWLHGGPLDTEAQVLRVRGHEGINILSRWEVDLWQPSEINLDDLVEKPVVLTLGDETEGFERRIDGIVLAARLATTDAYGRVYRMDLAPEEELLLLTGGCRLFHHKTAPEIIKEVLNVAGLDPKRQSFRLLRQYAPRVDTTQHGETDWEFVERQLAEGGICYWFDVTDEGPVLVFGDGPSCHDPIAGDDTLPFSDGSEGDRPRGFYRLSLTKRASYTKATVLDYDVRAPDVQVTGNKGDGACEYLEYPCLVSQPLTASRAEVRLDQLQNDELLADAVGDCLRVQPGRTLKVIGASESDINGEYVAIEIQHEFNRDGMDVSANIAYSNFTKLLPATRLYRPNLAQRPKASGIQVAFTTGPSGEEIHTNDLAEVTLRFPWDRSGIADHTSSYWKRTVQMALGGSQLVPRMQWEVPVTFLDGDPDHPIVLGRTYNATSVLPYAMPGRMATTTLQSATSPGDGSTNELRMADDAGSQEMFLHASRDQSVSVGGSSTVKVGIDETHDVGLSCSLSVGGSQTCTIGAQQDVSVVGDYSTNIKGSRSETVGGLEHTKVTANRLCKVDGAYVELVGAIYGMQCNQENIDVTGAYLQMVGGSVANSAGMSCGDTIAGARNLRVGGVEAMTLRAGYSEGIKGAKTITSGPSVVKASGPLTTKFGSTEKIKVGGAANIKGGGQITVKAPKIKIDVKGKLDAGGLKLTGGTFKISSGTSKLDGTIKRKGGSKIE